MMMMMMMMFFYSRKLLCSAANLTCAHYRRDVLSVRQQSPRPLETRQQLGRCQVCGLLTVIARACSAAVPHVFRYSLEGLAPELWHFDLAVAALLFDFLKVPHVAAIPSG